ncbi:MAG: amidohydrolase family protein, partial [Thermoplasmata archaeon]
WKKKILSERNARSVLSKDVDVPKERVLAGLGPHAPYTVPKDILQEVSEFALKYDVPLHIHMQETEWEIAKAKKEWGCTPFQYLEKLGVTQARILAAHCVVTDSKDRKIMKKNNVSVLHNPASNLKLASGIAPVKEYLDAGINVSIGTDGSASNNNLVMLEEAALAAMLQKYITNDPRSITREEALEMITINGAKAMGMEKYFGSLEKGKQADLVVISTSAPHMVPLHSPLSNILYASNCSDIDSVMVAGRFVMENRVVKTMKEQEVIRKGIQASKVLAGELSGSKPKRKAGQK